MSFENHTRTLDLLFNANYKLVGPDAMKRIMKNQLDRDHDIVGGADYTIKLWKDSRLKYNNDEPLAVKALEML
jgi:hypothetical protein|tara:strand:+ start:2177 stop:2395 length:219 start_codon:yes stop_codon:yes gene_type:complete